jgi:5-methylthioadenosine/S-adenosylhomocysteine deaminase
LENGCQSTQSFNISGKYQELVMIDLLVRNTHIVTMDPSRHVYAKGAIAIHDGKILAVGRDEDISPQYEAQEELDGRDHIAMPGLINTHFHLPQVMMRGIYDSIAPLDKLKNYTWPIQGCYSKDDALTSAQLGLLEMIKSGTTAFLSTGMHPRYGIDRIAQAILDSGIRAGLSKYIMDTPAFDLDKSALHEGMWETGADSLRQARELIERWDGAENGRLKIWISPRSVGGCSPELLKEAIHLADEKQVGITAHWSEVPSNVEYTLKEYGLRPVFFARDIGLLGPNVVFAHGIYFNDDEIGLLAEHGTSIAHCPICNAKLAMGTARVGDMLAAGVNISLANDGMGVNNTADHFREMRSMVLVHRAVNNNPLYPNTDNALEMATLGGARAIMEADRIGSLEKGKQADLILVRWNNSHMIPMHDAPSALVWAANGSDVDTSIIDGQIVMRDRQVLTMNELEILAEAEKRKETVLQQAGVGAQQVWKIES